MRKYLVASLAAVACLAMAGNAGAATLQLTGFTSSIQTVNVSTSPAPNTPAAVGSSGFNLTDLGTGESFVAWCLDINHYLMGTGSSQTYNPTTSPFSNSTALSTSAIARVQAVFDANYAALDFAIGDVAAAFQMALWEAAYEADGTAMSMATGLFKATSSGSDILAGTFLANAAAYTGPRLWNMTFLEVAGASNRPQNSGQNLVTVAAVPLPAAGLLLLTGIGGAFAVSRRRRMATTA